MTVPADQIQPLSQPATALPDGSALCLPCGLCCIGVLFPRASLLPAEVDLARSLGLTINSSGNRLGFDQPCHLYQNNSCSIYTAARPAVCGDYRCDLLKRFLAGAISLGQGLRAVENAQALLAEVTALLPPDYTFTRFRQAFEQVAAAETGLAGLPDELRQNSALLLAMGRLEWYFIRQFDSTRNTQPEK